LAELFWAGSAILEVQQGHAKSYGFWFAEVDISDS